MFIDSTVISDVYLDLSDEFIPFLQEYGIAMNTASF